MLLRILLIISCKSTVKSIIFGLYCNDWNFAKLHLVSPVHTRTRLEEEMLLSSLAGRYGIESVSLRGGMVYGRGLSPAEYKAIGAQRAPIAFFGK